MILAQRPPLLPGLTNLDCRSVRDVRNHLLEHHEPDGTLSVGDSFSAGGPSGPILHSIHEIGKEPRTQDQGLYVNAADFCKRLEFRLERAIQNLSGA